MSKKTDKLIWLGSTLIFTMVGPKVPTILTGLCLFALFFFFFFLFVFIHGRLFSLVTPPPPKNISFLIASVLKRIWCFHWPSLGYVPTQAIWPEMVTGVSSREDPSELLWEERMDTRQVKTNLSPQGLMSYTSPSIVLFVFALLSPFSLPLS